MKDLPYAEEINYFQTSQTSADDWIEKACKLIRTFGGRVLHKVSGEEPETGRAAFLIEFEIAGDHFKMIWPVLRSRTNKDRAARIQAATLIYHDVKSRCLTATVLGARAAFFGYIMLPDGRNATQVAVPELARAIPSLFAPVNLALTSGDDTVDGEFTESK